MARRTYQLNLHCPAKGCISRPTFYEYTNRRDYLEGVQRHPGGTSPCTRHMRPDEVLSTDAPERTTSFVSKGGYWHDENSERRVSTSGFGPGFKAYAEDFREGTRLVVTARIELPCTCNGGWSVDENYQPEDYEASEPLRPEKGLIPCGFCNHGGWDAPWPPAPSQQEGEEG